MPENNQMFGKSSGDTPEFLKRFNLEIFKYSIQKKIIYTFNCTTFRMDDIKGKGVIF